MEWKAGLYIRFGNCEDNTVGYIEDGICHCASLYCQRREMEMFAKEKGVEIVKEYRDCGWTGFSFNRPGFKQMLADIESGVINCVIVKEISRFAREIRVAERYIRDFEKKGVRFLSRSEGIDTACNTGIDGPL